VSPRARVAVVTVAAAALATVIVVGAAALQSRGSTPERASGTPPLLLDLGLRRDAEAERFRRAAAAYRRGRRAEAARMFARSRSLNARVGLALARWPEGSIAGLEQLAAENPRSALVRLNLGFALFWSGRREDAVAAWRAARRIEPDSVSAVRADDLLHPSLARGLPSFLPGFPLPPALRRLSPSGLATLERAARSGGVRSKLALGVAYQRLGRPRSALRQFDAAAALAPRDVEARVAAAVGRFDKDRPGRAFSRLGPLTRRYGRHPSVRYHLGLLLLWLGEVPEAREQLEVAARNRAAVPGREAGRILERLAPLEAG